MEQSISQRFQTLMLRFHQLGGELPPLDKYGITPAQVVYLDYVANHPRTRLGDLAEALQYKPASVSTMVTTLENKGLLRKDQEQEDGRALSLNLTDKGCHVATEITDYRNKRISTILEKLEQDEKESLLRLLEKTL
ncbi:MAG: MarR family transcriptional regulator [Anaerolineaceae bacterium]|nr:MarR family transcriptional regulator [Anaerolineaceae bacterium]MDD4042667.1 MarR family transcriptional regulator [Anaerolineaceae bacterium]MDD4578282.1 MarR family transcriptional regulator [Anaerolineaceae bacterium]